MIADADVIHVDALSFDAEVTKSPLPVFIDVSTAWCPPCRVAEPVVIELARAHRGRIKFVAIDGDESPELAAKLGVRGFPTLLGVVEAASYRDARASAARGRSVRSPRISWRSGEARYRVAAARKNLNRRSTHRRFPEYSCRFLG